MSVFVSQNDLFKLNPSFVREVSFKPTPGLTMSFRRHISVEEKDMSLDLLYVNGEASFLYKVLNSVDLIISAVDLFIQFTNLRISKYLEIYNSRFLSISIDVAKDYYFFCKGRFLPGFCLCMNNPLKHLLSSNISIISIGSTTKGLFHLEPSILREGYVVKIF